MRTRVVAGWLIALLITAAAITIYRIASTAPLPITHWTGWMLTIILLLLAVYGMSGVRRRAASAFLLLHLHLGWLAIIVFVFHVDGTLSLGFNLALWLAFALVAITGAVGYGLERLAGRRQRDSEALPYPRIAERRDQLAIEAGEAFHRLVAGECPSLLARLYAERLLPFLAAPAHIWRHWFASKQPLSTMLLELDYAGASIATSEDFVRIREIVVEKSELDRRFALYWLQRGYLFVHLPASAALVVLAPLHIVFVHVFAG